MTQEQLEQLFQAAEEFKKNMDDGDLTKLAEADEAFHEIIYKASDNLRLNQVLHNLKEQIYRYRIEYLKEEDTRNLLVEEHEEICRAIQEKDVARAQELAYIHVENQRRAIIRSIGDEKKE